MEWAQSGGFASAGPGFRLAAELEEVVRPRTTFITPQTHHYAQPCNDLPRSASLWDRCSRAYHKLARESMHMFD